MTVAQKNIWTLKDCKVSEFNCIKNIKAFDSLNIQLKGIWYKYGFQMHLTKVSLG